MNRRIETKVKCKCERTARKSITVFNSYYKQKGSPGWSRDFIDQLSVELGSAALTDIVVFFVLALSALLLRILLAGLLTGLLAALLAALTGLAALLAGLTALLSELTTLLFVFLHIVCHEMVLPLNARLGARVKSTCSYLVAAPELKVGEESS